MNEPHVTCATIAKMNARSLLRFAPVTSILVALLACGDASSTDAGTGGEAPGTRRDRNGDDTPEDKTPDGGGLVTDEQDGSLPSATDSDSDGTPDALDCDPASALLRQRIVSDDLSSDKGLFGAADGFPTASWMHDGAGYAQTRLLDGGDAAFYLGDTDVGDVQVEVRGVSTEISGSITPILRQIFILVGGSSAGGSLTAHGCGIEVVQGETPTQKTSVVKLEGAPGALKTTVLERVARTGVAVGEEFDVKLHLEDGTLTCDVIQGGATKTTATATGLAGVKGSIGLFAKQTKALFKNIRACKLK